MSIQKMMKELEELKKANNPYQTKIELKIQSLQSKIHQAISKKVLNFKSAN